MNHLTRAIIPPRRKHKGNRFILQAPDLSPHRVPRIPTFAKLLPWTATLGSSPGRGAWILGGKRERFQVRGSFAFWGGCRMPKCVEQETKLLDGLGARRYVCSPVGRHLGFRHDAN